MNSSLVYNRQAVNFHMANRSPNRIVNNGFIPRDPLLRLLLGFSSRVEVRRLNRINNTRRSLGRLQIRKRRLYTTLNLELVMLMRRHTRRTRRSVLNRQQEQLNFRILRNSNSKIRSNRRLIRYKRIMSILRTFTHNLRGRQGIFSHTYKLRRLYTAGALLPRQRAAAEVKTKRRR